MRDDELRPGPEHKFTFGLWTVGNPGRDPSASRARAVDPVDSSSAWRSSAPTASTCTTTTSCRSGRHGRRARPHRARFDARWSAPA